MKDFISAHERLTGKKSLVERIFNGDIIPTEILIAALFLMIFFNYLLK